MTLTFNSTQPRQVLDITSQVQAQLPDKFTASAVAVTVLHTTAAITTADLDPGTDQDLLDALEGLLPKRQWRHPHNPAHAPDHLLASIIGPSVWSRLSKASSCSAPGSELYSWSLTARASAR